MNAWPLSADNTQTRKQLLDYLLLLELSHNLGSVPALCFSAFHVDVMHGSTQHDKAACQIGENGFSTYNHTPIISRTVLVACTSLDILVSISTVRW